MRSASRVLLGVAAALAVSACVDFPETVTPTVTDEVPGHFTLVHRLSGSMLLLERGGRFANLVMTAPEYDAYAAEPWDTRHAVTLTRRVLIGNFADELDFVIFTFDPARPRLQEREGAHQRVSNDVRGLGYPVLLPHDQWGGTRRLRSVLMLRDPRNLREGPSLHELAHHWGATLILDVEWAHWGLSGVGGQLGGWMPGSLETAGPQRFQAKSPTGAPFSLTGNHGNRAPYAPLELYMMGFLPPDSVPPVEVAAGGQVVDTLTGTFRADSIVLRTMSDVVRDFGVRRPAAADAPRHFRVLYVVLSAAPLDAAQTAAIVSDIDQFTRNAPDDRTDLFNFWEATGGRATLQFDGLLDMRN